MKKIIAGAALATLSFLAHALQPYVAGDKVQASDLKGAMASVAQKLTAAGFTVIGQHQPKGVAAGTIVVTEPGMLDAIKNVGGTAVVGAPLRVGVKADGAVSYINPEYWLRAFVRGDYDKVNAAGKKAADKLRATLGDGSAFGGDVPAADLPRYHYMAFMPRFDDASELKAYSSFEDSLKVVRDNLAKGVSKTEKVYEIVIPEKKIAVIGFSQHDAEKGEAWWVNKIGANHIAALPWEIFIVGNQIYSLAGRYRTALAWPTLTMSQFMEISQHPDYTKQMGLDISGF